MIIKSSKHDLKFNTPTETKKAVVKEKIGLENNNVVAHKSKKKKQAPIPVIEEPVIVVEEKKVEDEDLSKWLED
jgi:hypothetical protein